MSNMLKVIGKHLGRCVTKEEVVVVTFHVVEVDMEVEEGEEGTPEVEAEAPGVEEVPHARVHEARNEDEVHPDHEVLVVHHHPKHPPRAPETILDLDPDLRATTQDRDPNLRDAPDLDPTTRRTNPG